MAISTANDVPKLNPMSLVFNANSCGSLSAGQGAETPGGEILDVLPGETRDGSAFGVPNLELLPKLEKKP